MGKAARQKPCDAELRRSHQTPYYPSFMVNAFAFALRALSGRRPRPVTGYAVDVLPRNVAAESVPQVTVAETFDQEDAVRINQARLAHPDTLALAITGKRVLDAGSGVGHHAQFYLERDCTVVCNDGRRENIETLRRYYPGLEAHVENVESGDLKALGRFDIVHCYGLRNHI